MALLTLENIYITADMAEAQASSDLVQYQKLKGGVLTFPIFPEDVALKLWGTEVAFKESLTDSDGKNVLGCFNPSTNQIFINVSIAGSDERASFTVAHEVGHASLHKYTTSLGGAYTSDAVEKHANRYASALLIPKITLLEKMSKHGFRQGGKVDNYGVVVKGAKYFCVSLQVFEIRLAQLGFEVLNAKYPVYKKRIPESWFVSDDTRQSWA
jgi:Zn-dependent peptidase ImmA (M78 family)